jgi:alanyl-tRNA synthetase
MNKRLAVALMMEYRSECLLSSCFCLLDWGTHIRNTAEIGPVMIGKIENKGRQNRRVNIAFAE